MSSGKVNIAQWFRGREPTAAEVAEMAREETKEATKQKAKRAKEAKKALTARDRIFVVTLRPVTLTANVDRALHHGLMSMRQDDVRCIDQWEVGSHQDKAKATAAASKNTKTPVSSE